MSTELYQKVTEDLAKILHTEKRIFSFIALKKALEMQGEFIEKKPSILARVLVGLALSFLVHILAFFFTDEILGLPLAASFIVVFSIFLLTMPTFSLNISSKLKFSAYSKEFSLQDTRVILRDLAKTKGTENFHKVLLSHKVDLKVKRILEESLGE